MKDKAGDVERILKEKDRHGIINYCHIFFLFMNLLLILCFAHSFPLSSNFNVSETERVRHLVVLAYFGLK